MSLEIETPNDTDIVFRRSFRAPRKLVWDAHTKPELIRQWLLGPEGWTMPVCEVDLRVDGRFRYVWRNADGRDMALTGVYREIRPQDRIVHNETFDDDWTAGQTTVTTLFAEREAGTLMTLTVRYASKEAREGAMQTGMTDGMEQGYARLDATLAALAKT